MTKYTIEATPDGYKIGMGPHSFEVEGGHNELEQLFGQAERVWDQTKQAWEEQPQRIKTASEMSGRENAMIVKAKSTRLSS